MPFLRSKKLRDKVNRVFTIVFLIIFVLAIAGGLIAYVIKSPTTQTPITSSTP